MKTAAELNGTQLVAKVTLHNYRYPRHNVHSGDFAIVVLDVVKVIEGEIPVELQKTDIWGRINLMAKGKMPKLDLGEEYLFIGKLIIDGSYGPQYECLSIHLDYDMTSPDDQRKFFSYFLTERQIDLLFELDSNPVQLLESKNIGALTSIKGIGQVTATRMCMRYEDNKNNGRAYIALKDLGLTKYAIDKLVEQLGSADIVVSTIEENPYSLIRLVRGYGWEKCDKMARARGFAPDCEFRVLAYAQHLLQEHADLNGNSCVDVNVFLAEVVNMCAPINQTTAATYIKKVTWGQTEFDKYYEEYTKGEKKLETPIFFYSKDDKKIGLFYLRRLEKDILTQLVRLQGSVPSRIFDRAVCEKIIADVETEQGYEYTSEQKKAMWNILEDNVSILTGSAGTGKSSTLKPLIRIFQHYGMKVEQCAFSGRASSLLSEITKLTGKTIHRLLGYSAELEQFTKNERDQLCADAIILDETSMVGEELFLSLLLAIKTGAKLIMLGDVKQLPPLAVGNILNDCIKSGYIHTSMLSIIHRQARKSGIIAQSIHVCEGTSIVKNDFLGEEVRGELKDFKIITNFDSTLIHQSIIDEYKRLMIEQKVPSDDIQIIVPVRTNGVNSCYALNKEIQQIVNVKCDPSAVTIDMVEKGAKFPVTFKTGDRIIVNKNNYHVRSVSGGEVAIFNGNIGHIKAIGEDYMVLNFEEQGDVIVSKEDWWNINLAYAITCHKLQGSQAPYCIIGLDYGAYVLLSREWLYTALTRAKKYCALVCQPKAVNHAVRTSAIRQKQTWLNKDLADEYVKATVGGEE